MRWASKTAILNFLASGVNVNLRWASNLFVLNFRVSGVNVNLRWASLTLVLNFWTSAFIVLCRWLFFVLLYEAAIILSSVAKYNATQVCPFLEEKCLCTSLKVFVGHPRHVVVNSWLLGLIECWWFVSDINDLQQWLQYCFALVCNSVSDTKMVLVWFKTSFTVWIVGLAICLGKNDWKCWLFSFPSNMAHVLVMFRWQNDGRILTNGWSWFDVIDITWMGIPR